MSGMLVNLAHKIKHGYQSSPASGFLCFCSVSSFMQKNPFKGIR